MSGYVPTDTICEDAKTYIPFDFLSVPFEINNPAVAPLLNTKTHTRNGFNPFLDKAFDCFSGHSVETDLPQPKAFAIESISLIFDQIEPILDKYPEVSSQLKHVDHGKRP